MKKIKKKLKKKIPIQPKRLRVIPLGGLGEIGKNLMVLEYEDDIVVIDMGFMFPEEEMLGIDYVIPDVSYLEERKEKIRAIIITHGHEDHIGGIPYLLPRIPAPIFATRLTAGMIEKHLSEFRLTCKKDIRIFSVNDKLKFGNFDIEFFHVTHSIPDGVGLIIKTPVGIVVHTGDFKFDPTPVYEEKLDEKKLLALKGKVLLLLSDSTNAEEPGETLSERVIGETFSKIFSTTRGRIIIASFASLISRIQQVLDIAAKFNRKVAISGRSMIINFEIAKKLGYLKVPKGQIIDIRDVKHFPDEKIVIISTGSQGEPMSALVKMASGAHPHVKIKKGDTVILSSSPIPGNEAAIYRTIDDLLRQGAKVEYSKIMQVHVSGHGCQKDLEKMIKLVEPKYFVPIHGEYHHLVAHKELAIKAGFDPKNIFVIENGQVLELDKTSARVLRKRVPSGIVLVDGLGVGDVGHIVLRDRQAMAKEGIFVIIATVDKKTGRLITSPDIISRGFVYMKEVPKLIEETREEVKKILKRGKAPKNWAFIKNALRDEIGEFLYKRTERRPLILPVVIEV